MLQLCATPYDMSFQFFYFRSFADYKTKYAKQPECEEYEFDVVDGNDFEVALATQFLKESSDLKKLFEIVEKHYAYTDENVIAIEHLFSNGMELEKALEKYQDVLIVQGKAEHYVYDLVNETEDIKSMGYLANYIDYKSLARDMIDNGEIEETKLDYKDYTIVCNSY